MNAAQVVLAVDEVLSEGEVMAGTPERDMSGSGRAAILALLLMMACG